MDSDEEPEEFGSEEEEAVEDPTEAEDEETEGQTTEGQVTEDEHEGDEEEEEDPLKPRQKTRAELLAEEEEPPRKVISSKRETNLDFNNVIYLSNFLSKVKLDWPEDFYQYNEKVYNAQAQFQGYPRTYYHNKGKEKAVAWHAENFRQQFQFKYPDRRPLFIAPLNECGFQKLFPTYIKPRLLPYPQLFYAETCVEYFKEFFNNDFLEPSTDRPKHVRSHLSVLKDRKANCYEHAIMIATVLLGAGYNAYVVDGYATKEVTTLCALEDFVDTFEDKQDAFESQLKVEKVERPVFLMSDLEDEALLREDEVIRPVSPSKYKMPLKKHFVSEYQEMMKEREEVKRLEEEEKTRAEELAKMEEEQIKPEVDPLLGFRIHAWVLILPGSRNVEEPFFLEPFSGTRKELWDDAFLGIEAVFNHRNYWANLQSCATGVGDLTFELEDTESWAKILQEPVQEKKEVDPSTGPITAQVTFDEDEEQELQIPEMYIDMPVSWTLDLFITPQEFKMKYPGGTKSFEYNDAIVERAAPYAQPDGMVQRVFKFSENSRMASKLLWIDERFDKRQDKLIRRKFVPNGRIIHEYFDKGRPDSLKEHIYFAGRNKAHSPRHLFYYSGWHPENVYHRQILPNGLIERFENRKDRLIYRETSFGGVLCITVKEKLSKTEELKLYGKGIKSRPSRIILAITEKFERDPAKDASKDIAEKQLLISQGKIRLLYHYGNNNYTRATLEFFKPENTKIRKDVLKFLPENSYEFHVDPFTPPLSNYKKIVTLREVTCDELKIIEDTRQAEEEIYKTVTGRLTEDWHHKLDNEVEEIAETPEEVTPSQEDGHEAISFEAYEDEEEGAEAEGEEVDFATPYLLWGQPEDKEEEIELKKRIMQDAKDRITRRAEYIADCYYEESKQLKRILKQGCTQLETKLADTENYEDCFQRSLSRLHVMEKKMLRLQAKAPRDYCNLLVQVLRHPRLNKYALEEEAEIEEEAERLESIKLLEFAYKLRNQDRGSCCRLDYFFDFTRGYVTDDDEYELEFSERKLKAEEQMAAVRASKSSKRNLNSP